MGGGGVAFRGGGGVGGGGGSGGGTCLTGGSFLGAGGGCGGGRTFLCGAGESGGMMIWRTGGERKRAKKEEQTGEVWMKNRDMTKKKMSIEIQSVKRNISLDEKCNI